MSDKELWLHTLCKKNGIFITDIELQRLTLFESKLLEWNKKINLVSRKDEENIWKIHIFLSISFLFMVSFPEGADIVDLGTGGGLPGIPLSILRPDCRFTLVDSIQKKAAAASSMARELDLKNVVVVAARAEDINRQRPYAHHFDLVVARSVSNLENLLKWALPFLKRQPISHPGLDNKKFTFKQPSLVTLKGGETEPEVQRSHHLFPAIEITQLPLNFPGSEHLSNQDKKIIIASA